MRHPSRWWGSAASLQAEKPIVKEKPDKEVVGLLFVLDRYYIHDAGSTCQVLLR